MAPSKTKSTAKSKSPAKAKTAAKPPSKRSKVVEKKVEAAPEPKKPAFAVGDKVSHKLFGLGKVLSLRDDKLSIQFGKIGTKEILADFVSAA